MKVNGKPETRRTQAERTAATQARLLDAGRGLFAADGFAAVSTQAIVDAAGVTRGALYHQFGDKAGLFAEVYEDVERDLVTAIVNRISSAEPATSWTQCASGPGCSSRSARRRTCSASCSSTRPPCSAGTAGARSA